MTDALVLCRFLHFVVVLMLFGAWLFRPLLLKTEAHALDRQLARVTRWLTAVALVSGVSWLLLITASMAGAWDAAFDPSTLRLVLRNTFFGQVWTWPKKVLRSTRRRVEGSNAASQAPAMLAVISSNQLTPLTSATAVSPRVTRASCRSRLWASAFSNSGLNSQAPNSISTTTKCRKRHSTSASVMNYWPTLKL